MISIKRNKIKNVILFLLIALLLVIIFFVLHYGGYFDLIYNAMLGKKAEKNIVDEIFINDVLLTYDKDSNVYYFPIVVNSENESEHLKIKLNSSENISCSIGDNTFLDSINLYEKINYDIPIEINVESFLHRCTVCIKFTNLPIISLNYEGRKLRKNEYVYSQFSITDPNYKENNSQYQFSCDSEIRYRGSFSFSFEKKSYRIKLDKNMQLGLLGLNVDKTWILDSMATDRATFRSKTSADLWANINKDMDSNEYTLLNSKYVEVYLNGSFAGLYLLKEVVDEDLLNLDKNTGVLIKGITRSSIDFSDYHDSTETYISPFEIKYPKHPIQYSKSWVDILDKMKDYYSGNTSYDVIDKTFYVDNLINYRIFMLILQAEDNYDSKNMYYSIINDKPETKVLITPWDLDLTFGSLPANLQKGYEEVNNVIDPYGIKDDPQFKKCLKDRWDVLSKSELSKEKVFLMLDQQYEYVSKAHALERENALYYNVDKKQQLEFLKDWYSKRFDVIDDYIKNL